MRSPISGLDLVGKRFGRLVIIGKQRIDEKNCWVVDCQCDCGRIKTTLWQSLRMKQTHSCGCLRVERTRQNGLMNRKHGATKTPEYSAWASMRSRCNDPNAQAYELYGGRGIYVCERWDASFDNFLVDMGKRPSKLHSIDRIDNDGSYCPENCRWAIMQDQARNRRTNVHIEYQGKDYILVELSEMSGVDAMKLSRRLFRWGWPIEKAIQ